MPNEGLRQRIAEVRALYPNLGAGAPGRELVELATHSGLIVMLHDLAILEDYEDPDIPEEEKPSRMDVSFAKQRLLSLAAKTMPSKSEASIELLGDAPLHVKLADRIQVLITGLSNEELRALITGNAEPPILAEAQEIPQLTEGEVNHGGDQ